MNSFSNHALDANDLNSYNGIRNGKYNLFCLIARSTRQTQHQHLTDKFRLTQCFINCKLINIFRPFAPLHSIEFQMLSVICFVFVAVVSEYGILRWKKWLKRSILCIIDRLNRCYLALPSLFILYLGIAQSTTQITIEVANRKKLTMQMFSVQIHCGETYVDSIDINVSMFIICYHSRVNPIKWKARNFFFFRSFIWQKFLLILIPAKSLSWAVDI